jgi:hypothetical protein
VEGFLRFAPRDFARLLGIAAGSLGEAEGHLRDGIELEYFEEAACQPAFHLARRCMVATIRLKQSQDRFLPPPQKKPRPRKPTRRIRKPPRDPS